MLTHTHLRVQKIQGGCLQWQGFQCMEIVIAASRKATEGSEVTISKSSSSRRMEVCKHMWRKVPSRGVKLLKGGNDVSCMLLWIVSKTFLSNLSDVEVGREIFKFDTGFSPVYGMQWFVFAGPWCGVSTALHVYCCTQGGCVPLRVDSCSAIYRIKCLCAPCCVVGIWLWCCYARSFTSLCFTVEWQHLVSLASFTQVWCKRSPKGVLSVVNHSVCCGWGFVNPHQCHGCGILQVCHIWVHPLGEHTWSRTVEGGMGNFYFYYFLTWDWVAQGFSPLPEVCSFIVQQCYLKNMITKIVEWCWSHVVCGRML